MGAKLDSKIGLHFTPRNGPIFRAETNISDVQCGEFESVDQTEQAVKAKVKHEALNKQFKETSHSFKERWKRPPSNSRA